MSFSYSNPLIEKFGEGFFRSLPRAPGVYFMHHESGEILYIGKAKDLRSRLSWYKNAKPGAAAEHTLELLENVARIRWEDHETEEAARLRESELLHAVRPPFNIADTWPQSYLYIGVRTEPVPGRPDETGLHFQLTSRRELARDYRIHGCYKHRRRTKAGYSALLRLLHAASAPRDGRKRFGFPARIARSSPPYLYSTRVPSSLIAPLERFLAGRSAKLLPRLLDLMLENEQIPRFMHPGLQDDIQVVQDFFRLGPHATHQLKVAHGLKTRVVSHRRMTELLRKSCEDAEARLNPTERTPRSG